MNPIGDTVRFALLVGEAGFAPIKSRLRVNERAIITAAFMVAVDRWRRSRHRSGGLLKKSQAPDPPGWTET